MKNLQDNPSIAIIVCFNGGVEMYHPSKKNVTKVVRSLSMMCASPIVDLIRDSKFYLSSHLFKTVASQDWITGYL